MGMKEDSVRNIGFTASPSFAPAWLGSVGWEDSFLDRFGSIDQRIVGRSIAAEIALHSPEAGEVIRENTAMKKLAAQFQ
jgi:hypothetical protein